MRFERVLRALASRDVRFVVVGDVAVVLHGTVRVAAITDLISMKEIAAGPQDLADIAALRELETDDDH